MFKNKKADRMDPNTTDTLIGEGSLFEGKIKSQASIRVEGQIVGDIECEGDVTIGENGVARSNIKARNVVLAGKVYGNLQAKGMLTIRASGPMMVAAKGFDLISAADNRVVLRFFRTIPRLLKIIAPRLRGEVISGPPCRTRPRSRRMALSLRRSEAFA